MKTSNYNLELTLGNQKWLFNFFNGGLVSVPGTSVEMYTPEEAAYLKSAQFLIEDSEDELASILRRYELSKYQTDTLVCKITPTLNCNFRCYYCFEKHTPLYKTPNIMGEEIQKGIVKFVVSNLKGRNSLKIGWFGGEPLLGIEPIVNISKPLIELCNLAEIKYISSIQTNGYLMNKENLDILHKCKVKTIQVTFDGDKARHDKIRFERKLGASFEVIFNNVRRALDKGFFVVIRINFSEKNTGSIPGLIERLSVFSCYSNLRIYFHPVFKGFSGTDERKPIWGKMTMEELASEEIRFIEQLCQTGLNYSWESGLQPRTLPCFALKFDSTAIDNFGNIVKCDNQFGVEEATIGNVFTGITQKEKHQLWTSISLNNQSKCLQCKLLPCCQGDCYIFRDQMNGHNTCPTKGYNYPELVRLFVANHCKRPIEQVGRIKVYKKPVLANDINLFEE